METPSLTALGAPSTRSFASFRPRPVSARTTLITFTLLSPAAVRITSNSVFSSAAAAPPPAAGAATATAAAAAETPNFSSISLISSDSSSTVMPAMASRISALVAI
ncbi:ribosomal protein L7/L12 [Limnobacter sp. MED105]|nr:ribosomal protein L7/L12 [Limnobacter sp. MED105]